MQFKHFYAFTALVLVCLLASCRSAIDFDNLDPTTEVETGITLPVGSIHMTVGDIMGEGLGKFYVDSKGVITWKDTFNIARNFHQVDLAKYISEKKIVLNVYDKIPAVVMIGTNKQVTGLGRQDTLHFDMPLKLKGINHKDSLASERLDSALIEMASFSSIIQSHNLPLEWEWIDKVTMDLGEQLQRPAGNTMVVYDKERDHYGYGQTIPTQVDNFVINLLAKNSAGQYKTGQVVDSCNFTIHFMFTIPEGTTVTVPEDAGFDYELGVQFIDYAAIWGYFSRSKDMASESTVDIGSSWGNIDFISKASMPFAEPKIDMHIITQIAGALKVDGEYLYTEDANKDKHYASFRYGGQDHRDFHRTFQKWEYLDPITSAIGDSTTNMMIPFDNDPERGQIHQMFEKMPQILGYKFNLDFDYSQTEEIRITPNTSIRIQAICTLPMVFDDSIYIDYKDTIKDVSLSEYQIESLWSKIDTVKASELYVVLYAYNDIPLDIKANMQCLDAEGKVIPDPADPSKPLSLFKDEYITLRAPEYAQNTDGVWTPQKPGETTIVASLTKAEMDLFPQIKHIAYNAVLDTESLPEGMDNVRLTANQGLTLKIGLSAKVDAVIDYSKSNKK